MKRTYLSPLRYPGAKRKLAHHIERLLKEYCCTGNVFVEPCCGGASVSLYLLEHKVVSSVILADKDPWVASFWKMLFSRTDELLNDIENVEVTVQQWKDFRAKAPQTTREKALYCFFFNRTCYSGILDGGMIGGHNQTSRYKIDCRFNKPELMDRIRWIADQFASKVQVLPPVSVFDVLEQAKSEEHEDRVYYIDPPYISIHLYPHNFKQTEHQQLKASLEGFRKPWILSYHEHPQVLQMYASNTSLEHASLDVLWVADRVKAGKELLINNLPSVRNKQPLTATSHSLSQHTLFDTSVSVESTKEELLAEA
ncbi:MAG TPA: DNA adenine methylase [Methylomirabilota bacterium]|nr:DNA adenine methylase [Methylomirabilota bacterium]